MTNFEYNTLFEQLIATPLQQVIGQALRTVHNYVLASDGGNKYLPKKHGASQAVHLVFDSGEIEFDWDAKEIFLDADGAEYHLIVSNHSVRAANSDALVKIVATDMPPWRELIGETLSEVEVLGERLDKDRCSPKVAILRFGSSSVVIGVGTASTHPKQSDSVGDGDEVLVFSEAEWALLPDQKYSGVQTLKRCWGQDL